MPADYKCTWFFESLQQNAGTTASSYVGWTETWYGNFPDIETCLTEMRSLALLSYLGKRLRFLPTRYRVAWVRASELANPNRSKLAAPPMGITGHANLFDEAQTASPAAQINCCVYVDLYVPPGLVPGERAHHRRFMIRGLPVGLILGNIISETSIFWQHLLDFCNYLGGARAPRNPAIAQQPSSPWRIAVQNPATPYLPLTSLIVDPDNTFGVVAVSPTLASAFGQKFRIKAVRFPSFVNRTWTANVTVAAGGGIVMKPGRKRLAGAWDHTGQIQPVSLELRFPTQYVVIGLRNKKIGSPSKPTRGRRRAA